MILMGRKRNISAQSPNALLAGRSGTWAATIACAYLISVTGSLLALATRCDTEPSSKSLKAERPLAPRIFEENFRLLTW